MIAPTAIQRFTERQRGLIHRTYNEAWEQGVDGYVPDDDPQQPTPAHRHRGEEATLSGALLLQARAQRNYTPPSKPDSQRRQVALAAALRSTERMAGELATLAPTPEQRAEAEAQADRGDIDATEVGVAALGLAVAAWAESNASRLDAGESVAWSGEQAGFAEAADQDGQLLEWQDEGDDNVCMDCADLADLPPLPLSDFPTTPGSGDTECNVGCRCALEASGVPQEDQLAPLSDAEEATIGKVAEQAQERLDALAPDFAATG